jgi:D-alanyl-D-alanine carboxypeptidase
LTRTVVLPEQDITISVLTNTLDGFANSWLESVIHILKTIHDLGAPSAATAEGHGRWRSLFGPRDLVPGDDKILVATPSRASPFFDASELEPTGPDTAVVAKAQAFGDLGEVCRLISDPAGVIVRVQIGGKHMVTKSALEPRFGLATNLPFPGLAERGAKARSS